MLRSPLIRLMVPAVLMLCAAGAARGYGLATEEVASGLDNPLFVTSPPDEAHRLFVLEQNTGHILLIEDDALAAEPFLDVSDRISTGGERGLLGLAFHPDYADNRRFFIYYTDAAGDSVIARYETSEVDPNAADPESFHEVLTFEQDFANHNGGMLAFGPNDRYLYIASGDGGSGRDPLERAQDLGSLLGKILRIDVDVDEGYAIPPDNPFVDEPDAAPEIWAYGLRNPWRMSFDRVTGELYIADVGQSAREEVNVQPADSPGGENYGWPIAEGFACLDGEGECGLDPQFTPPVYDYAHEPGLRASVTGGYVYRGGALPAHQGLYFFGDYVRNTVWSFLYEGDIVVQKDVTDHTQELAPDAGPFGSIASFGEDALGRLYIVDYENGAVHRIVAATPVGDVNGDGKVNAVDIQLVINKVLGLPADAPDPARLDVNQDGQVDALDIQLVINAVLGLLE